jgi:hypothetical protein
MLMHLSKIDYQNAAYAKVLQVGQPRNIMVELNMTPEEYNWVQSIYFVSEHIALIRKLCLHYWQISYIIFEVPSNLVLKRMTPRHWQSRIVLSWGAVLACHAAVYNKQGLYAARFFLGMMEAGMFPGLVAQVGIV